MANIERTMLLAYWTFLSSPMLWWGLAALAPIAIHLWSRRRFREVEWAAMRFLLAAIRKNARRLQWEQLLLLALRIAILILFALAVANPISQRPGETNSTLGTRPAHYFLVIDTSYSMSHQTSKGNRLDRALTAAKRSIEGARHGDQFSLIRMSSVPQSVFREPSYSLAQVHAELDSMTWDHSGANLSLTLSYLEGLIRNVSDVGPPAKQLHLYFFSDGCANTWNAVSEADNQAAIARLSETCSIRFFGTDSEEDDNIAVRSLHIGESPVLAGSEVTFVAELENFGDSATLCPTEFLFDHVVVSRSMVDLPPQGNKQVRFTHRPTTPGEHIAEIRLPPDAMSLDNQRWYSLRVIDQIRVMLVEGPPLAGRYLGLALSATESKSSSGFSLERVSERHWQETPLDRVDCLVLCEVASVTPQDVARLQSFVHGGGCLLVALGENVDLQSYNASFGALSPSQGNASPNLLGATLVQPVVGGALGNDAEVAAPYLFAPGNYEHPIVDPFRGFERAGLLSAPTWKYVRLEPVAGARTVLQFDTGDPAIIETTVGRGRVILFATALSLENSAGGLSPSRTWSALASWPCFPPLIHESIRFGVSASEHARNVSVGDVLTGTAKRSEIREPLSMQLPGDESVPLDAPLTSSNSPQSVVPPDWSFSGTDRAGVYRLTQGDSKNALAMFAVNLDVRESAAERLTLSDIPVPSETDDSAQGETPGPELTGSLFRNLLLVALTFLILESLLASRLSVGGTLPFRGR